MGAHGRKSVPLPQQRHYKYLVSTDGWTASGKLERYLLLGSTVLKEKSPQMGWFYDGIRPWEHYVPFLKHNQTDIVDRLHWLSANGARAN